MMISPSENTAVKTARHSAVEGIPVRLLGGGGREVSRLEFLPAEPPEIEVAVETNEAEALLKEELAVLDGRLQSQAERMAADMELARNEARAAARLEWEQELEERIAVERAGIVKACEEFGG